MLLRCTASREGKLNTFLRRELSMSSSLVSRLKWQNALLVNGAPAHTSHPVRTGDEVAVRLEETVEGFSPEEMPLSILYEDEALIALDKPAGLLTHPSPCRNDGTLANGLLAYYQKTGQRCGIHPVSRLDRDTFGVVLLAKNAYVHEKFRQLHQSGGIRKTYRACVYGVPDADCGTIDLPVFKLGGGSLLRIVDVRPAGRHRICHSPALGTHRPSGAASHHRPHAPAAAALSCLRLAHSRRPAVRDRRLPRLFRAVRHCAAAALRRRAGVHASAHRRVRPYFFASRRALPGGGGQPSLKHFPPEAGRCRPASFPFCFHFCRSTFLVFVIFHKNYAKAELFCIFSMQSAIVQHGI